jgi:hypothetical protein
MMTKPIFFLALSALFLATPAAARNTNGGTDPCACVQCQTKPQQCTGTKPNEDRTVKDIGTHPPKPGGKNSGRPSPQ